MRFSGYLILYLLHQVQMLYPPPVCIQFIRYFVLSASRSKYALSCKMFCSVCIKFKRCSLLSEFMRCPTLLHQDHKVVRIIHIHMIMYLLSVNLFLVFSPVNPSVPPSRSGSKCQSGMYCMVYTLHVLLPKPHTDYTLKIIDANQAALGYAPLFNKKRAKEVKCGFVSAPPAP